MVGADVTELEAADKNRNVQVLHSYRDIIHMMTGFFLVNDIALFSYNCSTIWM